MISFSQILLYERITSLIKYSNDYELKLNNRLIMGNCTGFCMTSNSEDQQPKKVTADKVKSALHEKDTLFKEPYQYEEQF